jgi:hypothetical protein
VRALVLLTVLALSGASACAASDVKHDSAADRYESQISRCTQLPDMDMQSCLADLNAKAFATEKQVVGTNPDVDCNKEAQRFKGGTGYWSAIYICSIRERAKRIDASLAGK